MAKPPITEMVLGIRWTVALREILGATHMVLRIEHPRLGPLDFLITSKDALDFAAALAGVAEKWDEARISAGSPGSGPS